AEVVGHSDARLHIVLARDRPRETTVGAEVAELDRVRVSMPGPDDGRMHTGKVEEARGELDLGGPSGTQVETKAVQRMRHHYPRGAYRVEDDRVAVLERIDHVADRAGRDLEPSHVPVAAVARDDAEVRREVIGPAQRHRGSPVVDQHRK